MQVRLYKLFAWASLLILSLDAKAQKVEFIEYNLPNGLHVILHEDHNAPVVAVSVMYHVGSKNEVTGRSGFAHFFEHLLFEGSENIQRGQFDKIVTSCGGQSNANTTQDRTFFYEIFPSNGLETGLWLESERMMHPVINEIGVKTQAEVVKEEKRQNFDNRPYGNYTNDISADLFKKHPYHNGVIGTMKDIDAAKLSEFKDFFKQFYVPNNAVLSISGDFDIHRTKQLISAYFEPIPRGANVVYHKITELPVEKQRVDTAYDANIQIPAIFAFYRIPGMATRDSKIMEMISSILSGGVSSRMYVKMVDEKKDALQVFARNNSLEDYGMYIIGALPNGKHHLVDLLADMNEEILKLQTDLISPEDYEKLQNKFENIFLNANTRMVGIAENLATGYTLFNKNTDYINEELKETQSITREEIRNAARKYLDISNRQVLYYLPGKGKQ